MAALYLTHWLSMNSKDTAQLDTILSALANPHRRRIVHRLSMQPSSISLLAEEAGLSLPAIHKHIKVLEEANLVQRKKHGRTNFLALNPPALQLLRDWVQQYHAYWGSGEATLENYVAGIAQQDNNS